MQDNFKVSTVTTLKASLEETLSFVNYHLNSGIDHMFLFFDDPEDVAYIHLRNNPQISSFKCNNDHWKKFNMGANSLIYSKQETNATYAFNLAKKSGFDWIIHIDSDELLAGPTTIPKYLKSIPEKVTVLKFPVIEAVPQNFIYDHPFSEIKYFKTFGKTLFHNNLFKSSITDLLYFRIQSKFWRIKKRMAKTLGSNQASKEPYIYGHIKGKSAIRMNAKIETLRPHFPIPEECTYPNLSVSKSFKLLHFDCLGFESWKKKWINRIDHNLWTEKISADRLKLHNSFAEAYKKGSIKDLYRDLYFINDFEKTLLRSLGLLKKIELNENLFKRKNCD